MAALAALPGTGPSATLSGIRCIFDDGVCKVTDLHGPKNFGLAGLKKSDASGRGSAGGSRTTGLN
jgi:hypothetical protein